MPFEQQLGAFTVRSRKAIRPNIDRPARRRFAHIEMSSFRAVSTGHSFEEDPGAIYGHGVSAARPVGRFVSTSGSGPARPDRHARRIDVRLTQNATGVFVEVLATLRRCRVTFDQLAIFDLEHELREIRRRPHPTGSSSRARHARNHRIRASRRPRLEDDFGRLARASKTQRGLPFSLQRELIEVGTEQLWVIFVEAGFRLHRAGRHLPARGITREDIGRLTVVGGGSQRVDFDMNAKCSPSSPGIAPLSIAMPYFSASCVPPLSTGLICS